jgi:hypothetical protein
MAQSSAFPVRHLIVLLGIPIAYPVSQSLLERIYAFAHSFSD